MSPRIFFATCLCLILGCNQTPETPKAIEADLVIKGAKFFTVNPSQPEAEAVAILDGRILKVGTLADVEAHQGPQTKILALPGMLALPGLIEGHGHFLSLGQAKMNLALGDTRSWDEVVAKVATAVQEVPPGTWILGRGWHQEKWDHIPEKTVAGFPTHEALSAISPDHPVLLGHASGHAVFANAKAMELAGIDATTPDPPGGEILRDETGAAIGLFNETAESLVNAAYAAWHNSRSAEEKAADQQRAIALAAQECLSKGITSFQDAGSSFADIELFRQAAKDQTLGLRLWVMLGEDNAALREKGAAYAAADAQSEWVVVGGIKRYIDGALGSRGAWLLEPYTDAPETMGQNVMSMEELRESAQIAKDLRLQLCTHAIGDRGNREVLDLFADFVKDQDLRWRIEHAQHLNPLDIPRFAELGVIASMQGIHCTSDAPFVEKRLGEERAAQGAYVWRKLLESGAVVSNGTDVPVEDVDPLANLYSLVTRMPKSGDAFYPDQALTIQEAIKAYTLSNAYATFQEKDKGSIEEGKLADFTILSQDITSMPPEAILNTQVHFTIVNGEVRYQKN